VTALNDADFEEGEWMVKIEERESDEGFGCSR